MAQKIFFRFLHATHCIKCIFTRRIQIRSQNCPSANRFEANRSKIFEKARFFESFSRLEKNCDVIAQF